MQRRQGLEGHENAKGARLAWNPVDQTSFGKSDHHAVDRRRRHTEEALHVSLCGRLPMDQSVHPDEGKILTLQRREPVRFGPGCH